MKPILPFIAVLFLNVSIYAQTYMYGTTYEGGANGLGTIYRVDENGQNFEKVFDFTTSTGGKPYAGLTLANGKLYGFTTEDGPMDNTGAVLGLGSFFEFDPQTESFTVIESVDDQSEIGTGFNHSPLLANDGLLYFASTSSGLSGQESILSTYNPSTSTLTILDTIDGSTYGLVIGKLMQASNNHIYFTTANGATNGKGGLVRWNTNGNQLEILHTSPSTGSGATAGYDNAQNQLLEGSDGLLYGLSLEGGDEDVGVFFKIQLDGSGYSAIHNFVTGISDQGFYPYGGLIEKNGVIYGTASEEAVQNVNSGTIFSFTLSNSSFNYIYTLDVEGYRPKGTFVESPNGRLYITTSGEPSINSGNLIEFNPLNGNVTQRHSFGTADGTQPYYDQLELVDFNALSVDETSLIDNFVKTYPNPVKENLNIEIEGNDKIESIKILDLRGSEIFSDYTKTKKATINTSFLSSGIYLLHVKTNNGSLSRKIVKE